jgi:hypothetical protein
MYMEKHLLLTVADDARSIFEAEFIGSFFKHKEEIRVTLFSVVPKSHDEHGDANGGAHDAKVPAAHLHRDKWQDAIHLKRELLLRLGFLDDHITSKVVRSSYGIIQDIILEGKKGLYDAVFLARHAIELLEQTFSTSVSREILNHKIDFPVWVCRHPEIERKNVLLCVDEDEASMRIADHVGFVLQQETEHNVTLFHVDAGEKRSNAQDILDRARQILTGYGISDARIRNLLVQSHRVTKSIREEAEKGAYAVIAIGHERAEPTGLKEWLVGSRCMTVLGMLNRCVLWVSR